MAATGTGSAIANAAETTQQMDPSGSTRRWHNPHVKHDPQYLSRVRMPVEWIREAVRAALQ
jgi:hypothetical protein